ncbi:hypothetical protein KL86DPRO_11493 [uncultured delta proteobacterium]|uniref:RHS repeat-associated core domain-containing protein n=1 Tax=uncultured delta proteobacterium TaxID=34034 RepID=A0A212JHY6_9DELT|nr:hypothetical protein KL86DPRO_11493 [uncultured delta proteobacterium]
MKGKKALDSRLRGNDVCPSRALHLLSTSSPRRRGSSLLQRIVAQWNIHAIALVDRDTGLVRFGLRDYDPVVGRFTSPDPLGDTGGDHDVYDYCVDDPVSLVDPAGLNPWYVRGAQAAAPYVARFIQPVANGAQRFTQNFSLKQEALKKEGE